MNQTCFHPKCRGNVEKRHSPVNIRFGVETSDIRNLKTSDQMLKHQKWQHCYSTNFKVLGRPGRESKSKPTRTIAGRTYHQATGCLQATFCCRKRQSALITFGKRVTSCFREEDFKYDSKTENIRPIPKDCCIWSQTRICSTF